MADPTLTPGLGIPDWMVRRALGLSQSPSVPPPVSDELAGAPGATDSSELSPDATGQGTSTPPGQAPSVPTVSVGAAKGEPIPYGVSENSSGEPVPLVPIQTPSGPMVPNPGGGMTPVGPQTPASPQHSAPPAEEQAQQPQAPSADDALKAAQDDIERGVDTSDPSSIAIGSYKMGALAADESSRRKGQEMAAYQHQLAQIQAQQQAQQRELMDQARDATLKVQAAADKMRNSAPDPSVLWGSQGSWGRALVTVMAAGGLGGPSTQAVVANVINMGMADQRAKLEAAREDVAASTADQASKFAQLKGIDDMFAANRLALAQSLQGAIANIDNAVMPSQHKAAALSALATFQEKAQDDLFKNKLEQAKANKLAGTGGSGGAIGGPGSIPNPYGKLGVYDPFHNAYLKAPDEKRAGESEAFLGGVEKSVRLIDHVLMLQKDFPTLFQKLKNGKGLTDEESAKIQTYMTDAVIAFNEAHRMKRLTNKEEEIYEQIGADPKAIEKWMPQVVTRLTTERNILQEDADAELKKYGVKSDIPGAPVPGGPKPLDEIRAELVGAPPPGKSLDLASSDAEVRQYAQAFIDRDMGDKAKLIKNLNEIRAQVQANMATAKDTTTRMSLRFRVGAIDGVIRDVEADKFGTPSEQDRKTKEDEKNKDVYEKVHNNPAAVRNMVGR